MGRTRKERRLMADAPMVAELGKSHASPVRVLPVYPSSLHHATPITRGRTWTLGAGRCSRRAEPDPDGRVLGWEQCRALTTPATPSVGHTTRPVPVAGSRRTSAHPRTHTGCQYPDGRYKGRMYRAAFGNIETFVENSC